MMGRMTTTYALRSNADGRLLSERYTPEEAAAAMRLDPWLADPHAGRVTLVPVDR